MTEQIINAQKINDWFTQQYGELDKTIATLTNSLKDVKDRLDAVAEDPYNPETLAKRAQLNSTVEYTQKALDNAVKAKQDKIKANDKAVRTLFEAEERNATNTAKAYTEEHFSKPIQEHVQVILDLSEQENAYYNDIQQQFKQSVRSHIGEIYHNPQIPSSLPSFAYSGIDMLDRKNQLEQAVNGSHYYQGGRI